MTRALRQEFALLLLVCCANGANAVDYVSVRDSSAILYDAPSTQAKKLFVVNRYMPFEQVVTLHSWVKVRDRSGKLYWVEKRVLSNDRYVFALQPLVDVRDRPAPDAKTVFQVRQQVALKYVESTGSGWIRVQHMDGNTGYVRSSDVWGD
jgi:SH3-like domain-containing protein